MNNIIVGDALTQLKLLEADSIDLLLTDPPYGYSFMNKDWDKAVVGVETWRECLRVLKPGAFAFIMSSPRQDVLGRMIVNLQDAGFRTDFTSLYHTYASGFPKAKNLKNGSYGGFQPKPAVEVILVVMKPLSEKSFTDQALANGKGVTWLDDCRIPYQDENDVFREHQATGLADKFFYNGVQEIITKSPNQKGRFPANLLVSDDVLNDGRNIAWGGGRGSYHTPSKGQVYGKYKNSVKPSGAYNDSGSYSRYFDLDKWFDTTFPFLIIPKASKAEKNKGLDQWIYPETQKQIVNTHPTVKPQKLMSYLIMLGSRSNDIVLDPFAGSGTTCLVAKLLKRQWIGIELNEEYAKIAMARTRQEEVTDNLLLFCRQF